MEKLPQIALWDLVCLSQSKVLEVEHRNVVPSDFFHCVTEANKQTLYSSRTCNFTFILP